MKLFCAAAVFFAAALIPVTASAQMIILTRHAERADGGAAAGATMTQSNDPSLSEAGKARAAKLASMLKDSGIVAIYTTEFRRTVETALPLEDATKVAGQVVAARDMAALIGKLKAHTSGTVLVVGHSNTVPEIIKALGGPAVTIDDADYDNMFFLGPGGALTKIRWRP
jgi:broad specificity phosphatase PhoE